MSSSRSLCSIIHVHSAVLEHAYHAHACNPEQVKVTSAPKGGSPSPDKVLAQKNDKSKDKFVNGLDVLSRMEDSDSSDKDESFKLQ